MNLDNCLKAIEVIKKRKNEISIKWHEERLSREGGSKRSIVVWLCHDIDPEGYPSNFLRKLDYNLIEHLANILDVEYQEANRLLGVHEPYLAISIIKDIVKRNMPLTEFIRRISCL